MRGQDAGGGRTAATTRRLAAAGAAIAALALAVAACGGSSTGGGGGGGEGAQQPRVALVVPLSGLYARQGELVRMGAEMAVDEINQQGGIRALDGQELVLDVHDAGETVQTAVTAANRALTQSGKPSAGIGSWLSSFTLGVTEVAERQRVPWVTLSFADDITARGFNYVYQTSAVSSVQADTGLRQLLEIAEREGNPIRRIALVGDNTAASVAFFEPVRESLADKYDLDIVVDRTWSPPIGDATSISRQLRERRPDAIVYGATNFTDSAQILRSNRQFGVDVPIVGSGAWLTTPEYVEGVGARNVEGILAIVGANPLQGQEDLVRRFTERTGEPFMIQDSLAGYYHVWLMKEAIERAGSADPEQVNQALKSINLTSGPAAETMPGGTVSFDERGRRKEAIPVIAQWQDAVPRTVFPDEVATAEPEGFGA
jgi:branched-chain amino acid transport system substrate-binding protein